MPYLDKVAQVRGQQQKVRGHWKLSMKVIKFDVNINIWTRRKQRIIAVTHINNSNYQLFDSQITP